MSIKAGDFFILEERHYYHSEEFKERRRLERQRQRRAEIRRKKRRRVLINRCIFATCCFAILFGFIFLIKFAVKSISGAVTKNQVEAINEDGVGGNDYELYNLGGGKDTIEVETLPVEEEKEEKTYEAHLTADTVTTSQEVVSERSILIDLATGDILMQKGYQDRISPASMTKVLTVLVAAEHLTEEQLDDKFTVTQDITSYAYQHDCSCVGFADNETVTVRDLLYGTILPSGADAAVSLATYIAGSHEEFVNMMNEKLEELGLSSTSHFTNCVGLYDDNHYSSVYDMAIIMEAAIDNEIAREALTAHKYTTSKTMEHPDGIEISNWFLRRIEDKDTGGTVICAKTGFVVQSKNCAVSYGKDTSGNEYIVCTQGSTSSWRCIYDHVAIYKQFEGKINHGGIAAVETEEEIAEENNEE